MKDYLNIYIPMFSIFNYQHITLKVIITVRLLMFKQCNIVLPTELYRTASAYPVVLKQECRAEVEWKDIPMAEYLYS